MFLLYTFNLIPNSNLEIKVIPVNIIKKNNFLDQLYAYSEMHFILLAYKKLNFDDLLTSIYMWITCNK